MIEYKGLRARRERWIVSDAQVDRAIERILSSKTRAIPVEGRPSRLDDELVLDYAGFADGVQFEGGTAQNQTLVLGSGTFIPGFEEQLVGKNAGEDVEVRVIFPAEYHAAELAGREAVFKCHIHAIRVPEKYRPDDVFAREVGGCASFAEYRESMRAALQANSDEKSDEDVKNALLDQLLARYPGEVGGDVLKRAVDAQVKAMEGQLNRKGLTLAAYCQFTNQTEDQLRESCVPDAKKAVLRQRIIAEIAAHEHIEADEASVEAALRRICRDNGMTIEALTPYLDESTQNFIVQSVVTDKVLNLILANAQIETVESRS